MQCKICGNELATEREEIEGVCEECREEYRPTRILFGPSLKEEVSE